MTRSLITLIIIMMNSPLAIADSQQHVAKIIFDNQAQMNLVNSRLTPLNEQEGLFGFYKVNQSDFVSLDSLGIAYEKVTDREPFVPAEAELDSFFYTYDKMVDSLTTWATRYSQIAHVETIGTSQQEYRLMYAIKISDSVDVDDDEPVIYFDGTHHACEIMGMEICMALAETLLTNYGHQQAITNIVDSNQIWIVPLVNPDGNSAVHAGIDLNYRKNGRDLDNDGILYEYDCNDSWTCSTEGVDLNRNYDWYWSSDGSSVPMNYYYRGDAPGSESEIQAIMSLVGIIRPVIALSYHSWGEVVVYPWDVSSGLAMPDTAVMRSIVTNLSNRIPSESGGRYSPSLANGRSGMNLNWQYARYGTISMSPETVAYPDFIPGSEGRRDSIISANLQGVFWLISRAHGSQITGRVTDRATGAPLVAEVRVLQAYSNQVDPRITEPIHGRYRHLLNARTYTVQAIYGDSVQTFNNVVVQTGVPAVLDIQFGPDFIPGDANGNGTLNGLDVVYLVNYFIGRGPAPNPLLRGDANGDCFTNGLDIVYLVNYFKGSGPAPLHCAR